MSASTGDLSPPKPVFHSTIPYDSDDEDDTWKRIPSGLQENGWNDWKLNDKVKTCECHICGERVRKWSWKCSRRNCHVCSECVEAYPATRGDGELMWHQHHYMARDWLKVVCGCRYLTKQAPYVADKLVQHGWVSRAPKRHAELASGVERKRKREDSESKDEAKSENMKLEATSQQAFWQAGPSSAGLVDQSIASTSSTDKSLAQLEPPTDAKGVMVKANDAGAHLRGSSTLVVGAGIIGLCIARELAMKTKQAGVRHAITVVDIRGSYCELASGNCAGLLSVYGRPVELQELCGLSFECWAELVGTPGFTDATDFQSDAVYTASRLNVDRREAEPSWYTGNDLDSFHPDRHTLGKLDSKKLATWLFEECYKHDVSFIFNHSLDEITLDASNRPSSANILCLSGNDRRKSSIQCQNVVFATGPFTAEILESILPESFLQLKNHVRQAHWLRLPVPRMTTKDHVGLLLPDLANADRKLDGTIWISGQLANDSILICGQDKNTKNVALNPADALLLPENSKIPRRLRTVTAKCLRHDEEAVRTAQGDVRIGSSFISTSEHGLPVLDEVPVFMLNRANGDGGGKQGCGIWLCFGFEAYGTTLAPGAARALCRRIFGEASRIDDETLSLRQAGNS